jgi:tetratricopeptide (TPR) repeat protein
MQPYLKVTPLAVLLLSAQIFIFSHPPDFQRGINDSSAEVLRQSKGPGQLPYPLEQQWEEWAAAGKITEQQDEELYFLYSLTSYQKESWDNEDLTTIFKRLETLDPTLCSSDLLVQHLFAKERFDKIADLPLFKELNQDLGLDIILMGACALDFAGKATEADKYFTYLEQKFADNEQVIHQMVVRLIKQGAYTRAIDKIDNFLKNANLRPKHAAFFCLKAYILADTLGKREEALQVIDAGLELNPRSEKLLRLKFTLLMKEGMSAQALNVLQLLVTLTNDTTLRNMLITLYYQTDQHQKALEEMQQLEDESFEHLFNKAILLLKLRQEDDALSIIDDCLIKNPAHPELKAIRFQLLFQTKQFEKLVTLLLTELEHNQNTKSDIIPKILALTPVCRGQEKIIKKLFSLSYKVSDIFLYMALADLCLACGFYSHANHIYGMLETIFSKHPILQAKVLCATAKIYFETGHTSTGIKLVKQALQICPKLFIGWRLLAEHFFKNENPTAAAKFVKKALMLNPVDNVTLCLRDKIYRQKARQTHSPFFSFIMKQQNTPFAIYHLQGE